jgi:hypothetical protein
MSITSANAVLMLSIPRLYNTPQQIQGFAVDDIYDIEALEVGETQMGVDGILSAGFVFTPVRQGISLIADSPSVIIFDTWYAAERQIADKYAASATINLPGVGKKYAMTRGFLTTYPAISDGKKVLQGRKFVITWQSITMAPM